MLAVLKNIHHWLSKYIDVQFFLRFFLLLTGLYLFNNFYIALLDQRGAVHSPFLENYLNYTAGVRYFILYTSKAIVHVMGVAATVYPPDYLQSVNRSWIKVEYGCLGINLLSFWMAFVMANKGSFVKKLGWCAIGVAGISFINSWRIAFLLISFERHWNTNTFALQHTIFNYTVYALIILMMFLFSKYGRINTMKIAV